MKAMSLKIGLAVVLVLGLTIYHVSASQNNQEVVALPKTFTANDSAPVVSAKAYAIFDAETGKIIVADNSDTVLPIASVTKLMTAAAVMKNLELKKTVTVTFADHEAYGRAGRLEIGDVYTNHELLFPLLLESSNDAAAVYERETAGEIVVQMNALASDLGATQTKLFDASGLSDRNVSTANDLVKIITALRKEESHIFDISRLSKRAGEHIGWTNNNPVWQEGYMGGKHGFTEAANKTLVALFKENLNGEERIVGYVLLGSEDLVSDTKVLRDFLKDSVRFE